ncbi:MAG TPA: hypothetical protein VG992_04975 [Candidatus Saccharimonadales bacterium]|nr:hypothetical protein [Candidatus Saccharimonadales bacterium]
MQRSNNLRPRQPHGQAPRRPLNREALAQPATKSTPQAIGSTPTPVSAHPQFQPTQPKHQIPKGDLWDRIWKDSDGRVVIFEMPNVWIIGWVILVSLSLVSTGNSQSVFWWLSLVPLVIWAYLEIFHGVNYFRRAVGLAGLLLVIAATFSLGIA